MSNALKSLFTLCILMFSFQILLSQPFQNVYTVNVSSSGNGGHFADIVEVDPSSGPYQMAAIGTFDIGAFNDAAALFMDPAGNPIVWMRLATGVAATGVDVCTFPGAEVYFILEGAGDTYVVAVDPSSYTVSWVRKIIGMTPRAAIAVPTASAKGVYILGNQGGTGNWQFVGLDLGGGVLFSHDYTLTGTSFYISEEANDLEYVNGVGFTLVGAGLDGGTGRYEMMAVGTGDFGNVNWANFYPIPASWSAYQLRGKAVEESYNAGNVVVAADFSQSPALAEIPMLIELDPGGNIVTSNLQFGGGPFSGPPLEVRDIEQNGGGEYLVPGVAYPGVMDRAFSMVVDPGLNGVLIQEYRTTTHGSINDQFNGNCLAAQTGFSWFVGEYNSTTFPWAPNRGFWVVATDPGGFSVCPDTYKLQEEPLAPPYSGMGGSQNPGPMVQVSGVNFPYHNGPMDIQCHVPKRELVEEIPTEVRVWTESANQYWGLGFDGELTATGQLEIRSLTGQLLKAIEVTQNKTRIANEDFANGIYLLRWNLPGIGTGAQKVALVR